MDCSEDTMKSEPQVLVNEYMIGTEKSHAFMSTLRGHERKQMCEGFIFILRIAPLIRDLLQ